MWHNQKVSESGCHAVCANSRAPSSQEGTLRKITNKRGGSVPFSKDGGT